MRGKAWFVKYSEARTKKPFGAKSSSLSLSRCTITHSFFSFVYYQHNLNCVRRLHKYQIEIETRGSIVVGGTTTYISVILL